MVVYNIVLIMKRCAVLLNNVGTRNDMQRPKRVRRAARIFFVVMDILLFIFARDLGF